MKYFLEYGQFCKGNQILQESKIVETLNSLESQLKQAKAESLELRSLIKWLYINTNGLDSNYEVSPDFVENLATYLEPLEYCLENKEVRE